MPPIGRELAMDSSGIPGAAIAAVAAAGSSSRVSAPISRSTAARSSASSRPNEYRIFGRDIPAAASHSLCAR